MWLYENDDVMYMKKTPIILKCLVAEIYKNF